MSEHLVGRRPLLVVKLKHPLHQLNGLFTGTWHELSQILLFVVGKLVSPSFSQSLGIWPLLG